MTTHPRSLNLKLRRARQSLRLSQAQFAEVIRTAGEAMGQPNRCSKRLVQKWESGCHAVCKPEYLIVLETVTGLCAAELGFPPADHGGQPHTHTASGGEGTAATGTAVTGTVAGPTPPAADDGIEASIGQLRYALDHPSSVDARCAEFAQTATTRLFDIEHHTPAILLVRTAQRHLATVTGLLTAARAAKVRRTLTIQAGVTALLAGSLAAECGNLERAHEFWDAATGAAQATTDEALLAAVLTFQAEAAARSGDPATAWHLTHTATRYAHNDERASAWITSRSAHYAAVLGEHAAAEQAMYHALELSHLLPPPGPATPTAPWTRSFDHARLASATAHTAALLGDPSALDYATEAIDTLSPAKTKSRAIVLAEAAITAAIVGKIELSLTYGTAAATITRDLEVTTAADLLHDLARRLLPHTDTPTVRKLLPRLTQPARKEGVA